MTNLEIAQETLQLAKELYQPQAPLTMDYLLELNRRIDIIELNLPGFLSGVTIQ